MNLAKCINISTRIVKKGTFKLISHSKKNKQTIRQINSKKKTHNTNTKYYATRTQAKNKG